MIFKGKNLDDHRRVVLPETFPPHCTVTIQELDEDTLIVRRQRPRRELLVVLEPDVKRLPEDRSLDALAEKAARGSFKKLPKFDEL